MTAAPRILAECVATRIGEIKTSGGIKPVMILELYAEPTEQAFVKYLNCNRTETGRFTVPHNSDFAKLYRLTTGANPIKRYSRADQLLRHFCEYKFLVEYEKASQKNGKSYLKVGHIEPEKPVKSDDWTATGSLKQRRKVVTNKATNWRQVGDEVATNWRRQNAGGRRNTWA